MEMNLAACVVTFLFCPALAQATVRASLFQDSGLDDLQFEDDVTFTISQGIRSELNCARRCNSDQDCVSFTYGPGGCRGHSVAVTAQSRSVSVSGARTYLTSARSDTGGGAKTSVPSGERMSYT